MHVNDDLAIGKHPYNIIACLPVQGRLPLLKLTIQRLFKVNGCSHVICSGDGQKEKDLCESLGAIWVKHPNKPLGAKWNAAFLKAKQYNPDAVVYVGSSDWLSSDWFYKAMPLVEKYHFVGMAGCHFAHVGKLENDIPEQMNLGLSDTNQELRAVWWPGYKSSKYHTDRGDETIGIGRMLSREVMDLLYWRPFYDNYDNSLDRSMKERCMKVGYTDYMIDGAKALSISVDRWPNKHNFSHHWNGAMPSDRIVNPRLFFECHFPELLSL